MPFRGTSANVVIDPQGLKPIGDATVDLAGASSATIGEGFLTDEFDNYVIQVTEAKMVTATLITMTFSQAGGSQTYSYHSDGSTSGSTAYAAAANSNVTNIEIFGTAPTTTNTNASFKIYLPKPASAVNFSSVSYFGAITGGLFAKRISGGAESSLTDAITAVTIALTTGSFQVGTMRLYGVSNG